MLDEISSWNDLWSIWGPLHSGGKANSILLQVQELALLGGHGVPLDELQALFDGFRVERVRPHVTLLPYQRHSTAAVEFAVPLATPQGRGGAAFQANPQPESSPPPAQESD